MFMSNTMNLNLTEKRGDKRLHIQDEKFDQNYTRSFLQSRNYQLTDTIDSFMKAVAEVYFCLQENGIEPKTSFATRETTFEFIQKVIEENPGTDQAQKAIRLLLTIVATNTKRPTGSNGEPLHKSLNTNRANVLKGYYDDYDISYTE